MKSKRKTYKCHICKKQKRDNAPIVLATIIPKKKIFKEIKICSVRCYLVYLDKYFE